ncbi:MAG: hypothetical protein WC667_12660 [Sulfurimonas sp.]|jgi:hypothetical protein
MPDFMAKKEVSIFEQNEELKKYFEEQNNSLVLQKISNMTTIIQAMKEPKRRRG